MRTVPALLVTLLAPIGPATAENATVTPQPADTPASRADQAIRTTPAPAPATGVERQVSLSPSVNVVGADADHRTNLDTALAAFRDHGLELPDLEVRFSDDDADCGGHLGRFETSFAPWRLSICSDLAFVAFHELAHAWEAANVDDDTRARYVAARDLPSWNALETRWADRGVEDAARMIQINLMTERPQLTLPIWTERLDAYELLVGRPSPLLERTEDQLGTGEDAAEPLADSSATRSGDAETSFRSLGDREPVAALDAEPVCVSSTGPAGLTSFFDLDDPMIGADYQRSFALPDGRVLWLFQDAFLPTPGGSELVHNVGLLQSGRCFQLLRTGSVESPAPYLLPELVDPFDRWFWPLGGGIGLDGDLHVFVAEMRERGDGYLVHTEAVATWLVSIELDTFTVVAARPAPNPSPDLYGWSVVSHGDHTFLYAHCYRQFGWDLFPFADPPIRAHDWSCGPEVRVARVPRADFGAEPEYWNGSSWTIDAAEAVPVIPQEGRSVNPSQIALHDGRFVAITKVGDWWGDAIHLDVAPSAEGPWRTYATVPVVPECDGCNTYFASILPYGADESSFVVGLSTNTWGGDDLHHYSPTFFTVPAPARDSAGRAALVASARPT